MPFKKVRDHFCHLVFEYTAFSGCALSGEEMWVRNPTANCSCFTRNGPLLLVFRDLADGPDRTKVLLFDEKMDKSEVPSLLSQWTLRIMFSHLEGMLIKRPGNSF
jgi:hypothetical protein